MKAITITSDFGTKDYYLGALKGSILSILKENLPIIDINNNIVVHDIVHAAYCIKNSYQDFPEGSIHLVAVNNVYSKEPRYLVTKYNDHFFIAPDNGVLSLIFDNKELDVYKIEFLKTNSFSPLRSIYSQAISYILSERPIEEVGMSCENMMKKIYREPLTSKDIIKGTVIHIDSFENVIFNIKESIFEKIGKGRSFEISYGRNNPLFTIYKNYSDVAIGDCLILFNDAGYLELAINMGKASSMLGLEKDDFIQVRFKEYLIN